MSQHNPFLSANSSRNQEKGFLIRKVNPGANSHHSVSNANSLSPTTPREDNQQAFQMSRNQGEYSHRGIIPLPHGKSDNHPTKPVRIHLQPVKIDEDEAVDSKDALERSRSSPTVMTKLGTEVPGIFFAQKVGEKLKPAPNMMHVHLKDQLSHQSLHHYPHMGPTKLVPDSPSNKRRKLSNKETAPDTLGTEESVHSGSVGSKHFDMNSLITMFQANQPNEKSGSLRTCLDFPSLDVYVVKDVRVTDRLHKVVVEEFLEEWQIKLQGDSYFNSIKDVVHQPDTASISAITEYVDGVSLQDIFEELCPLNPVMIKELTGGLLTALKHYYIKVGKAFLGLSPSSVIYAFKKQKFILRFGFGVKLNMLTHFQSVKPGSDQTLNYYKSLRKKFWIDLFGLGLLIIRGIFGTSLDDLARLLGFYLPDLFQPDILNFNSEQGISAIPERCREFCCLFHYMDHIVMQDEHKMKGDIANYVRIYEISSPESIYVACTQFRNISKPLKDFLCHLTHLDFKNPTHFHDDILSHEYANDCLNFIKNTDRPIGLCNLYEAVKMIRHSELKVSIGSDGCWFQGVGKTIELLHRTDLLYLEYEDFERKVKTLARILGMDRHRLQSILEKYLYKKPARRQLY